MTKTPILLRPIPSKMVLDVALTGQVLRPRADGTRHPMIDMFENVLRRARERESRPDEAAALADLGRAYLQTGHADQAIHYLSQSLPLYRVINDREREGLALELICMAYRLRGDTARALESNRQALTIAEDAEQKEFILCRSATAGMLLLHDRQAQAAIPHFQRSIKLAEALGLDNYLSANVSFLGQCYQSLGDHQASVPLFRRAMEVFRREGNQLGEYTSLARLGMDLAILGQRDEGIRHLEEAARMLRLLKQWLQLSSVAANLGQLHQHVKGARQSMKWFQEAIDALEQMGTREGRGSLLAQLGLAAQMAGDEARAQAAYAEALPTLEEEEALWETTFAAGNLGGIYMKQKKPELGIPLLERAASASARLGEPETFAVSHANLGLALCEVGLGQSARRPLEAAAAALRLHDAQGILPQVLRALHALSTAPAEASFSN